MSLELWLLFVPAAFALNVLPGPNNMLAMTNGLRYGLLYALKGGVGRLLAFSILIFLTATGLGAILSTSVTAFYLLKIAGALYLVYLGYRLWRSQPEAISDSAFTKEQKVSTRNIIRQEFFVAITNPKAILIFTAFFPQFLVADTPMLPQFGIMGITFTVLEIIALILYAVSGRQLAFLTRTVRGQKIMNRTSGSLLIGAGGLLAISK
ncbi:LysE family translocator [Kiloniella laminariae]|uniref:LysE family translocator n=1 Tax=Kiloniella laminariae TaxID=454162 RepID=UPI0003742B14|nr:LysE family translocator [Kiloniella laminariae]